MRDIVHIQVGQCGNQISSKVFLTRTSSDCQVKPGRMAVVLQDIQLNQFKC